MKSFNLEIILVLSLVISACGHNEVTNQEAKMQSQNDQSSHENQPDERFPTSIGFSTDQLNVKSKFKQNPNPYNIEDDDESTVIGLMATVFQTVYSSPMNDFLDLSKASSHTFISPTPNSCDLTTFSFKYVGPADELFNLEARDAKGKSFCQEFFKAIRKSGLQMQFENVPLLNHRDVIIQKVLIEISNP